MSAFVCGQQTYNEIYAGLNAPNIYTKRAINTLTGGRDMSEVIDILYRLNIRAVNQRYESNPTHEQSIEHTGKRLLAKLCKLIDVSQTQFLKSLECLRYQMTEGNVPETKEYKQLGEIIDAVKTSIIKEIPEYAAAHWD